jgi:enediyne biosynthesis protein E4
MVRLLFLLIKENYLFCKMHPSRAPHWFCLFVFSFFGCTTQEKKETLFVKLDTDKSGVTFINTFVEDKELNVLQYEYLYNGAGVGIGDFNNDGLADIYFTGNLSENKLYLNKGHLPTARLPDGQGQAGLRFEDITSHAGVKGRNSWKTGVSIADINGDGLLDIYVCHSGPTEDRDNELFINNGVGADGLPTFSEQAHVYGLDAPGTLSTQAAFFDYDLDGDLDMFLLNHARIYYSAFANVEKLRTLRHPQFGNRLYRNDNNQFVDVSAPAGIFGGGINFGLGIVVSDINLDHWPDIYVTNDYEEKDYLYINNQDGTFTDQSKISFGHLSKFSMGVDIADFNNDLRPDVITLDMLPEDNHRQKLLKGPDEYDKYQKAVEVGYYHQNMRNMLHLNVGTLSNGSPAFSEVAQLAGVSNTDWSWSALLADYDNDGAKDLFITNGYVRDYTNMDFLKYDVAQAMEKARSEGRDLSSGASYKKNMPLLELVQKMPSTKISNYIFRNAGDLTFKDQTAEWGLREPGVSTGAAYADLDNDGDLDIIVNNIHEPSSIYENTSRKNNFLKIKLEGNGKNRFGLGAKVYIKTISGEQYQEAYPIRGFQSSMDYTLHFGIGNDSIANQVRVEWPDGNENILENIKANQTLVISKSKAHAPNRIEKNNIRSYFKDITNEVNLPLVHKENSFVDFKYEPLLLAQQSRWGPALAKADVNNDGLEDFFVGGAAGQSGELYLQTTKGFVASSSQPWAQDSLYEDVSSLFVDVDHDGHLDLYVVSGGNESRNPDYHQDRLYRNLGKGKFVKLENALPSMAINGSTVQSADYDKDGDADLFIGGGGIAGSYPLSSGSRLLRNDTHKISGATEIKFTDVTKELGLGLSKLSLVTDAIWMDIDNDSWIDLIAVGAWMPITIFKNNKGTLKEMTTGLDKSNGFWNRIAAGDFDNDNDVDFIVGNLGANTQLKCSVTEPLQLYVGDFNNDGKIDPILCKYFKGISYPIHSKDELASQLNFISKKFIKYADYAEATIEDLLSKEMLAQSKVRSIYTTKTSMLENLGNGQFKLTPLPVQAQFSSVQGILVDDFNHDKNLDVFISGNFFPFKVELGRCDAGLGELFLGNGHGQFQAASRASLGVTINGDVRNMIQLKGKEKNMYVIAKNNESLQIVTGTNK